MVKSDIFKMDLKATQVTLTSAVVLICVSPCPPQTRARGKSLSAGSLLWKVIQGMGVGSGDECKRENKKVGRGSTTEPIKLKLFAPQGQKVE